MFVTLSDTMKKCPVCSESLPSKAALRSHVEKVHPSQYGSLYAQPKGPKPKAGIAKKRGRSSVGRPAQNTSRPMAKGALISTTSTSDTILSGTDRLVSYSWAANTLPKSGQTIVDELITTASFKRLSRVSSVFQKIFWEKLEFQIVGQSPTTTSGGFVVGFVADPQDMPPLSSSIRTTWLTAMQGSISTNWWESASLSHSDNEKLFTSARGESRLYSPGRLMMVCDGPPSQAGTVVIYVKWKVRLSEPSLEEAVESTELSALMDLYIKAGSDGVFIGPDSANRDARTAFGRPDLRPATGYWAPWPITTSAEGGAFNRTFAIWIDTDFGLYLSIDGTSKLDVKSAHSNLVFPRGTIFIPHDNAKMGEQLRSDSPLDLPLTPSNSSLNGESLSLNEWEELRNCLLKFATLCPKRSFPVTEKSKLKASSTEYQPPDSSDMTPLHPLQVCDGIQDRFELPDSVRIRRTESVSGIDWCLVESTEGGL